MGRKTVQASRKENGAFKTCLQSISFPFFSHPSLLPTLIVTQMKVKVKTLGDCSKITHATGFSQWLMTNLVASPFMGDGRSIAVGGQAPTLPSTIDIQNFSPTKVGAQFLRQQIRAKARSLR